MDLRNSAYQFCVAGIVDNAGNLVVEYKYDNRGSLFPLQRQLPFQGVLPTMGTVFCNPVWK